MIKRNIYLMCAIACLQGMVFYAPIATLYRQAQGVTLLEITIIESISLALSLFLEIPWGIFADKIGYKNTMIFCNILYFLSKIVFWQAEGFGAFLLERILLAMSVSGLSGVDTSILYLSCIPKNSHRVFGIYNAVQTLGLGTAALVYSVFIGTHYKTAGFLTMGSYGLAAFLTLFLKEVKEEKKHTESFRNFFPVLKEILHNKPLLLFLTSVAVFHETHQTVTVFLNQLQYERSGIMPSAMGYLYILITLAGFFSVFSEKVTKKYGSFRFLILAYVGSAMICILLAFTTSPLLSVGSIFIFQILFSLSEPLQTVLQNRQITTANRATALSIQALFMDSVGIGTNLCFGALSEKNLTCALLFGSVLCFTGILFLLFQSSHFKKAKV